MPVPAGTLRCSTVGGFRLLPRAGIVRGFTGAEVAKLLCAGRTSQLSRQKPPVRRLGTTAVRVPGEAKLSREVYFSSSVAALGVAVHDEVGRAVQHGTGCTFLPVVQLASQAALPLFFYPHLWTSGSCFSRVMTLHVEHNASSRALARLKVAWLLRGRRG